MARMSTYGLDATALPLCVEKKGMLYRNLVW
jgi:hypothetical protein